MGRPEIGVKQQLSDLGLDLEPEKHHRPRRGLGCLAVLVALAVLGTGGYFVYTTGVGALKDKFSPAANYSGGGTGSVMVEVKPGDAASDIAGTLVSKDVVKSSQAFTEAAQSDPRSRGIQVGFYQMKHKMSAKAALAVLVDPSNVAENTVTFPEGWSVKQIVAQLAKKSHFSAAQFDKVLKDPSKLGLPSYAQGNPEGYLFPATYQIKPNATPLSIITMMVDRFKQSADKLQLTAKSQQLGYSPHDVMTVASLIQAEARLDKDFPKVGRVIYNRLKKPMALQFDSTVHYAVGRDGKVGTSSSDRHIDSPYNTYKYTGLPPTPIMAPGEQAIDAALNPADGTWLYFVTTDPDTGETKFATSYQAHLKNVHEFQQWCAQSTHC
jgi:UPF0755 protein